jgi:hypothetical protein
VTVRGQESRVGCGRSAVTEVNPTYGGPGRSQLRQVPLVCPADHSRGGAPRCYPRIRRAEAPHVHGHPRPRPAGRWVRRSAASSGRPACCSAPSWAPPPPRSSSTWPSTRPGATASPTGSAPTSLASWKPPPRGALLHRGPEHLAAAAVGAGGESPACPCSGGCPRARAALQRHGLDPERLARRLLRQGDQSA